MPTGKSSPFTSKGVLIRPEGCATPGTRIAYMRLAVHKTHKPVAYTQDSLAAKAGVSADAIHRAESDELSLKGASIQAICRALSMPPELLTCSMSRWLKVVNNIGLEARILAAGRKDLAARARKVSSQPPTPKSQVSAL